MREYEGRLAELEGKNLDGSSPPMPMPIAQLHPNSGDTQQDSASELASSSAQDQGSESSVSDAPVSVLTKLNEME